MKACAAPFCNRSPKQNGVLFYPFPENKALRALWIEKLHLKYVAPDANLKICSRHFKPSDFIVEDGVKSLSPKSFPSLYINKKQSGGALSEDTESDNEASELVTSTASLSPEESTTRKKPCRRAAMLAAEKIINAVNMGPGYYAEDDDDDDDDDDEEVPRHLTKRSKVDEDYNYAAEFSIWKYNISRRNNRCLASATPTTASRSSVVTSTTTIIKPSFESNKKETPYSRLSTPSRKEQKGPSIRSPKNVSIIWPKDLRSSQKASPSSESTMVDHNTSISTKYPSHGITLECSEELLSSIQLNSQLVARKKYASALETIAKYKTLNAKVIDEDDSLVQSPPPSSPLPSPDEEGEVPSNSSSPQENCEDEDLNPPLSPIAPPTREKTNTFEPSPASVAPPLYKIVKDEKTGVILAACPNKMTSNASPSLKEDNLPSNQINGILEEEGHKDYPLVFEINGGDQPPFIDDLLSLKISPPKQEPNTERELEALRNWLEEEGAFARPVQWMLKHGLMSSPGECRVCKSQLFLEPDSSAPDGFVWKCLFPKCMLTTPIARPVFFSWFGIPLGKLLELCYHWALHSDPSVFVDSSDLDLYIIRKVWKGLQDLCGRILNNKVACLGGSLSNVEVAVAGLGSRLSILCAYDRKSRQARFKSLLKASLTASVPHACVRLVDPLASIISADPLTPDWKKAGFHQRQANSFSAIPSEGRRDRTLLTISGAKEALQLLVPLFDKLSPSHLTLQVVQGILNEFQWRTRFGRTNLEAFWNLLNYISEQSGGQADLGSHLLNLPEVSEVPSNSNSSTEISDQSEEEDATKLKKGKKMGRLPDWVKKRSPDYKYPLDPMPLDEFYYSKMMPSKVTCEEKFPHTFQCYECKEELPNNIKVMSHMRSHLEHQLNPHLLDMLHCRCCYRPFPSPYSMHCHMEKHLEQDGVYPCRICMVVYSSLNELLQHMTSHHHKHEMPYSCKICNFRSSFQKDIVEHFVEVHGETNYVLCQFCMKVYTVKVATSLPGIGLGLTRHYHQHMVQHTHSASSRKCPRCNLVFLSDHLLRAHIKVDHHFVPTSEDALNVKPYPSPDPSRTIILPRKVEKPPKELPAKSKPTCSKPKYYASVKDQRCLECNNTVDENHFSKVIQCDRCSFTSFCYGGFLDHLCLHEPSPSSRKFVAPVQVFPEMYCSCGYTTGRGNQIADHLHHCGKKSCHSALPTAQQIYEVDDIEVFAFYQQEMLQQRALEETQNKGQKSSREGHSTTPLLANNVKGPSLGSGPIFTNPPRQGMLNGSMTFRGSSST